MYTRKIQHARVLHNLQRTLTIILTCDPVSKNLPSKSKRIFNDTEKIYDCITRSLSKQKSGNLDGGRINNESSQEQHLHPQRPHVRNYYYWQTVIIKKTKHY